MGYKILVFEQQPDANLGNFVFESPSYREAFVRRPDSVYLRGLTDADLRDWRGSSTLTAPYLTLPALEVHDPTWDWNGFENTRVWRAGNRGAAGVPGGAAGALFLP